MSYDSQFLKYKMEQVWLIGGCVRPCHIASWSNYERGYRFYNVEKTSILLWFKSSKMLRPRKKKIKGKGFSFLVRNY